MNNEEEVVFWRLAYLFISEHGYRIIQLFEDQTELWLEKLENKKAPVIRLLLYNINWSNSMQRDIEFTASNGEKIRKQIGRKTLNIANIYVSKFPPVDEYEYRLTKPFLYPDGNQTAVYSYLLAEGTIKQNVLNLSGLLGREVTVPLEEETGLQDAEFWKKSALEYARQQVTEETAVFRNGRPIFTWLFILIQAAVFLWLELNGGSTDTATLIKYGAKFNPLIYSGQWWRFITPVFLHIGFMHLAMNSLALYFVGVAVEQIYGNIRFAFIYLFAGVTGFIASFLFSANVSAGASGAIFGCIGALLFFGAIYPRIFFRTMGINLIVILLANLLFDFSAQGIDNAGHFGGLAGGFLAAGMVFFPKKKKFWLQLLFLAASIAIVWGALAYGFSGSVRAQDEGSNLMVAQDYINKNNFDQAYRVLHDYEMKASHPSDKAYFLLSYVEIKKGMNSDAKTHLEKAITLNPDFDEAYFNLALINLQENNIKEAKDLANKAASLKPDNKQYSDLVKQINQELQ